MKQIVIKLLQKNTKLKKEQIEKIIEIPPAPELGDYAFPCFILSEELKKSPVDVSTNLAKKLSGNLPKEISGIKASGPYLNFFVNKEIFSKKTIKNILIRKEKYGKGNEKSKILIEFMSPNTNKPLHVGHLRNLAIGESVSRILEFSGNRVTRINLYNDRGIHIIKSMLAYKKFGKNKKPKEKPDKFVGEYYVLYNRKLKQNPELEKQAREMLKKWEDGDKEVRKLWEKMNSYAYEGIEKTYKNFGVEFDKHYYESEMYEKGKQVVEKGLKKGIFQKAKDNSIKINLGGTLGEKILLRKDGTSVYITQDLYLAEKKAEDFNFDKSMYVTGNEQIYHFKVLFKILKLLDYKEKLYHLSYGMVNLPSGKMKSREGKVVDADDLIEQMENLTKKEIKKRCKIKKEELEKRAEKIALAAIKYFLLKVDVSKDMLFNPEKAIDFEGDTGPYLQYSYARASSIIRKSRKKLKPNIDHIPEFHELQLIKKLNQFPEVIKKAEKDLNPSLLANYAYDLAKKFNEFYHKDKVIGSKQEVSRLAVVEAFRIVIKSSLSLLGIEVIEEM